ncbi:MAG: acyltransferase [Clostridium sp.]|uniref:acyltransferase n=1 Tax=Clostridium sp. TaxID=1506 RepID=UPI0025BE854A|nr:acyltransferase [Clostridium sp.]MBS5927319.1 acyltransferase [Clostridium sp.]
MKRIGIKFFIFISKIIMTKVYGKEYLKGRWFETSSKGWRWCWKCLFMQKLIGYNRKVPFPVSHRNNVGNYKNIIFNPNDLNNFQNFGCYYQSYNGKIIIGEGTYIAPNVGLITQNHKIGNIDEHDVAKNIVLGCKCWIGMNSIILPGVKLGDNTVVGAGAVVTKSFEEGNCIIAGNPAKIIRRLSIYEEE